MTGDDIAWAFIRSSFESVARTAVVTMQVGGVGWWVGGRARKVGEGRKRP